MSQSSLKILVLGSNAQVADSAAVQLRGLGVESEFLAITNSPESDAEIARIIKSKDWDGITVGKFLQLHPEWLERVKGVVHKLNSKIVFILPVDRDDLENAVEQQFKIKLPITKT